MAITAIAALLAARVAVPAEFGTGLDRAPRRWEAMSPALRAKDGIVLAAATFFLLTPLAMIVGNGIRDIATLPSSVWVAAARSTGVALAATALTIALALPVATAVMRLGPRAGRILEGAGYLPVAASPLVIGTGLFIMIFPVTDTTTLALPLTALVNAALSVPFALRAFVPALAAIERDFGRLAASVDLGGTARWRLLVLPRMRRPLGFVAGLAAALSMGDLGVIALFADPETATLPLQIYRLMAAYQMDDANAAALLLLVLSLGVFWLFDRGGRRDAET